MTTILNDDNFAATIASGITLVDFYADWCGPCQAMIPVVEELAKEFAGKVAVAKIDVDAAGATASEHGVMSIPTFKVFKNGQEVASITGAVGKEKLVAALNQALA